MRRTLLTLLGLLFSTACILQAVTSPAPSGPPSQPAFQPTRTAAHTQTVSPGRKSFTPSPVPSEATQFHQVALPGLMNLQPMAGSIPNPTPAPGQLLPGNPIQCGPPSGWIVYEVLPGDTLYSISRAVSLSVSELQNANCLASSLVRAGQQLYLPSQPAQRPTALPTLPAQPYPSPGY